MGLPIPMLRHFEECPQATLSKWEVSPHCALHRVGSALYTQKKLLYSAVAGQEPAPSAARLHPLLGPEGIGTARWGQRCSHSTRRPQGTTGLHRSSALRNRAASQCTEGNKKGMLRAVTPQTPVLAKRDGCCKNRATGRPHVGLIQSLPAWKAFCQAGAIVSKECGALWGHQLGVLPISPDG